GVIFIMFSYFAFKALLKKRNRISITLSLVFIIPAIGILINILYRTFNTYEFSLIGNKFTIVLSCLGLINIYFFVELVSKSQVSFSLKKQIIIFVIYALLLSVLFFIPNGVDFEYKSGLGIEGYKSRDPDDLGVPVWSTAFFLYGLILSQLLALWLVYITIKQYQEFGKGSVYGRKYIYTLIGMILMDVVIVGSFVFNWLNDPLGRTINLLVGIFIFPAIILLYLGLRQEKE
ncbi:MAG: hypothetical protein ACTSYY_08830, partial [Promethearchaeota archaeon]